MDPVLEFNVILDVVLDTKMYCTFVTLRDPFPRVPIAVLGYSISLPPLKSLTLLENEYFTLLHWGS